MEVNFVELSDGSLLNLQDIRRLNPPDKGNTVVFTNGQKADSLADVDADKIRNALRRKDKPRGPKKPS